MIIDDTLKADLMATAHALADLARPVTLRYFRQPGLVADNKAAGGFDPVTVADREAEQVMRAFLAERRPDDGILGEEFDPKDSRSGLTWVLDPIDGTRGFISGTPTWGVLVAVNAGAAPLFGLIDQPYIGERFAGGFGQATVTGPTGRHGLAVRPVQVLADAVIYSTFPEVGTPTEAAAFHALAARTRLTRYGMDCYAYALLAAGQVDLVVEAGLKPYDVQGPIAVVSAAGGIVTDWQGGVAYNGGRILAAGTAALHRAALTVLKAEISR